MNTDLRGKILDRLIHIVPNGQDVDYFSRNIPGSDPKAIQLELDQLVHDGLAVKDSAPLPGGGAYEGYKIPQTKTVKIRKKIQIGNSAVPRVIAGAPVNPEAINESVEALAGYADSLETRFKKMVADEMKPYWTNIIVIFGTFTSILAFIIVSAASLQPIASVPYTQVLWQNTAKLLPLAAVIAFFLYLLKRWFK